MFHFFELKAASVNLVHQSNWLLVRRTWATWSALNFFHVGQDSSGMLTYDESILAAFGSQRIVHQSEGIAQGPDGSPLSRDTPGFSWRRALLRIPDSRIHFAKKIIIIIFIIQLFFLLNVCTYLEFYHSRSRWFSGWKDHQGCFLQTRRRH